MEATAACTSSSSSESILQALISRGWCFRDTEQVQGLIAAQLSSQHGSSSRTVDSVESELLNMDLRSIGGKCLPHPSLLSKTLHLQAPLVLQVCSSRDISRSSIADSSGNSGNKRLLRLKLTDGHSEITAVEYSHVPSIPDDVIPGTKVRLQNKADIFSGIVCLNSKVIIVLGGTVQSLYEEWKMKRKYMDISSYSLKLSKENASGCPPFEKFQIGAHARVTGVKSDTSATRGDRLSDTSRFSGSSSDVSGLSVAGKGESSSSGQTVKFPSNNAAKGSATDDVKQLKDVGDDNQKQTQQLIRPKVAASVPVQNQEAAQKLLQKTCQPNYNNHHSRRGRGRGRGRGREEESNFLTLDEWERRKHGVDLPTIHVHSTISRDEDLARQMQEQFDLEDMHHAQMDSHGTEAKDITMSMFNFERNDASAFGRADFRGRGRGRRGRGRGRT